MLKRPEQPATRASAPPPVVGGPLVGREAALAELRALLQSGTRLLTLTGAGGTGKSRLALHLAADLNHSYQRTWFVDLTTVRDPDLVLSAVAQAVGVSEAGDEPLRAVFQAVAAAQPGLMVIDNFEHVLDAAGVVAALLSSCPDVVIVTTSREALGLRPERVYFLEPLPVPDLDQLENRARLRQIPSIVLFAERASARRADFQLTDETLPTIAEICARLDGLPLAIELAAAQAAVLPPALILKRLQTHAPFIVGAPRDLPARHRTLQATVEWSYELLEPVEKAVFRACGVFVGGFTPAALETALPGPIEGDVLAIVARLVTKSLVRVTIDEQSSEPRFWLLETIRDYALAQLLANGELSTARRRHGLYYVSLAEGLQGSLRGPGMAAALDQLAREYANFRAVFRWVSEAGDFALGLRLAAALYRFWAARGPLTEARAWLDSALARSEGVPPRIRARALNAAGVLAGIQHDHDRARTFFRDSLELWQELGEPGHEASAHLNLGLIAHVTGQVDVAERAFERAHELFRAVGDRRGEARTVASRARLAREQEDFATARHLAESALELFRAEADDWGAAFQLANLGHISLALEDQRGATAAFREALQAWQVLGNLIEIAECLDGIAAVAAETEPRQAARLLGAAAALRHKSGAPVAAVEQRRYAQLLARVQARLPQETFAASWQSGRSLAVDEAIAFALGVNAAEPTARDRTSAADGVLSSREQEIARLIAAGRSNRDIAESLVVSIKTVESHVQHIFRKLNVKARAEVAVWAARNGLL